MPSPSVRLKPSTMATKVYNLLRNDILEGVFPAGSHLVRRTLAKRYGVSMLPILEACLRLEADGLVENSPLLGAYVIDISPEKAKDEIKLREAIECQAAREYAVRANAGDREHLMEQAAFLDSVQEKLDPENHQVEKQFQKMHSELHIDIARHSGATLLHQHMKKVWYRRLMLVCNVNTALFPNPKGWHAQLMAELNSGDPDRAEKEMRRHVLYNFEKHTESVLEVRRRGRARMLETLLSDENSGTGADDEDADED